MSENKTVWITGANGFLGRSLLHHFNKEGYDVVGTDLRLDITDEDRVVAFAQNLRPKAIINCAGIRRDAASLTDRLKLHDVNALGARNIALAAEASDAIAVQASTDDVYATKTPEPVTELDHPHPDTPYGNSKRDGETYVRDTTPNHVILRSSWLYRATAGTMRAVLEAAEAGKTIEARTDQYAAPTSVYTYCHFMQKAIENEAFGTYNVASKGKTNRYGLFAKALELCGYDPEKVLVPTEDADTAEFIILESLMTERKGIMEMKTWEQDLEDYLRHMRLAR